MCSYYSHLEVSIETRSNNNEIIESDEYFFCANIEFFITSVWNQLPEGEIKNPINSLKKNVYVPKKNKAHPNKKTKRLVENQDFYLCFINREREREREKEVLMRQLVTKLDSHQGNHHSLTFVAWNFEALNPICNSIQSHRYGLVCDCHLE